MTKLDFAAAAAPALMCTAALFAAASPGPAVAQSTQVSITVKTSDLDLSDASARRTLDGRIDRAARRACGIDVMLTGTRIASAQGNACYRQALHATRNQVAQIVENSRRGG